MSGILFGFGITLAVFGFIGYYVWKLISDLAIDKVINKK